MKTKNPEDQNQFPNGSKNLVLGRQIVYTQAGLKFLIAGHGLFFGENGKRVEILMKCPFCHTDNDKVVDTRPNDDGSAIRRRRLCCSCDKRFTTFERVETTTVRVVKRDGTRVPFDPQKIRNGVQRSCLKRPITEEQIMTLIAEIENDIEAMNVPEVSTQTIGEMVMKQLRELDQVAYVRFASIYREFKDIQDFAKELQTMLKPRG